MSDSYTDTISFNGSDPGGTPNTMLVYIGGTFRSYVDFSGGRVGQSFCYAAQGISGVKSGTFAGGIVNI